MFNFKVFGLGRLFYPITYMDYSDEIAKRLVLGWGRTGALLEEIRIKELQALGLFDPTPLNEIFDDYIKNNQPSQSSGLVEQQYWFKKNAGKDRELR